MSTQVPTGWKVGRTLPESLIVSNPVRGMIREVGVMAHNKRRLQRAEQVNANKWESVRLLSAAIRLAEMLLDMWHDHLL